VKWIGERTVGCGGSNFALRRSNLEWAPFLDFFRMTSYVAFGLLKGIFGYRPEFFYAFTILVHILNGLLL